MKSLVDPVRKWVWCVDAYMSDLHPKTREGALEKCPACRKLNPIYFKGIRIFPVENQ